MQNEHKSIVWRHIHVSFGLKLAHKHNKSEFGIDADKEGIFDNEVKRDENWWWHWCCFEKKGNKVPVARPAMQGLLGSCWNCQGLWLTYKQAVWVVSLLFLKFWFILIKYRTNIVTFCILLRKEIDVYRKKLELARVLVLMLMILISTAPYIYIHVLFIDFLITIAFLVFCISWWVCSSRYGWSWWGWKIHKWGFS